LCCELEALNFDNSKVSFTVKFEGVQYHIPWWRLRTLEKKIKHVRSKKHKKTRTPPPHNWYG
jgi:hypothetical protein